MGILRLLLALSVVVAHSGPLFGLTFIGGEHAVQIFYLISGFYMAFVLNEKYANTAGNNRAFYLNRILRIFPSYLIVLVATIALAFAGLALHRSSTGVMAHWSRYLHTLSLSALVALLVSNCTILGQDALNFLCVNPRTGALYFSSHFASEPLPASSFLFVPQAWSIGVELLFYAAAPLLLRRSLFTIVLGAAVSIGIRVALAWSLGYLDDPWSYRFFPSELATFLIGALDYKIYALLRDKGRLPGRSWGWGCIAAIACGVAVLPVLLPNSVVPVLYPVVVCCLPFAFHASRTVAIDRYIGELSYPVYLIHNLVLWVLSGALHITASYACILCSVAGAACLLHFVDRPIERYRRTAAGLGQTAKSSPMFKSASAGEQASESYSPSSA